MACFLAKYFQAHSFNHQIFIGRILDVQNEVDNPSCFLLLIYSHNTIH